MGGDQVLTGGALAALLEAQGYDFFTGVPCSMISSLIATLEAHPRLPYIPAVREDVAVGLAAGAWMAGRRPMVLMQNSGLGTSLNALVSLALMYRLPALLLVTWRGHAGKDAPEHILMGEISPSLLDMIRIPHRILSAKTIADDVAWGRAESDRLSQPVALLLPPHVLETEGTGAVAGRGEAEGEPSAFENRWRLTEPPRDDHTPIPAPRISRFEALRHAVSALTTEPVVHANGYICRESFSLGDRPQNFYMIGSMGMASAIGLGLALARPHHRAVVFDGDGNLLMNLGILAQVGARRPANLVHCVFDNGVYGSTGNQASLSHQVRLDRLAIAAGYRTTAAVTAAGEVEAAVQAALKSEGPHFILVKVTREEAEVPRIPFTPAEIRDRFRASVLAG